MSQTEEIKKILSDAAEGRRREVMVYQINIDNYRLAVEEIEANHAGDASLQEFAVQLRELLATNLVEQTKEKIMLTVIERQLKEM